MLRTIVHGLLTLGCCAALAAGSVPPPGLGGVSTRPLCPASPRSHHMTCFGGSIIVGLPSPSSERMGTVSTHGANRG